MDWEIKWTRHAGSSRAAQGRRRSQWCSPLPLNFSFAGLSLLGISRIFLLVQWGYGVILVTLHGLLLAPPFNESTCVWLPQWTDPYFELFDLQFSFRIRGGDVHNWEQPLPTVHGFHEFGSLVLGVMIGVFNCVVCTAIFILFCKTRRPRCLEYVWLVFTTLQLGIFLMCNLGKLQAICPADIITEDVVMQHSTPAPRTGMGSPLIRDRSPSGEVSSFFPHLSRNCGALRVWFAEWTVGWVVLVGFGLLACWSHVNARLHESKKLDLEARDGATSPRRRSLRAAGLLEPRQRQAAQLEDGP